ncbi:MAG: amidohydrolase family protein [Oscillospiraceae bacterium]|nr:amidohydrolase family protein [Oscillospiraceae bacterium]
MMILKNAKLILPDGIQEGSVSVENGKIAWISGAPQEGGIDLGGMYLAPGFVDNHCHGSPEYWHFDHPAEAAAWHLQQGTTSLLCSMWRNAGDYSFEKAIENVKNAMGPGSNIRGVHMEAPYVDADYGSAGGTEWEIDREEYLRLMKLGKGIIRQWTFDPLLPGAELFAQTAQKENIKLSVCYSKASPEQLREYLKYGLRIGGHILCGTGEPASMFRGTREPGSDQFVLTEDKMIAEVIADSLGGHVRPTYLQLIYKCKGPDRIALVSDCCAGGDTRGSDVNVIDGELYGSQLSLSVAIRNMRRHTGADLCDLIKMVTSTPAKTVGLYAERGSIEPGKVADLVVLDEDLMVRGVLLEGNFVRKDF